MEIFTLTAVIYFVIAFPLTLITSAIEARIIRSGSFGAPPPRGPWWRRMLPGNQPKLEATAPVVPNPASVGIGSPTGVPS
jgi:polar amino acid transport system permease protein